MPMGLEALDVLRMLAAAVAGRPLRFPELSDLLQGPGQMGNKGRQESIIHRI
jgi:hypothetical protein